MRRLRLPFDPLGALAVMIAGAALIVGLTFPRQPKIPPPPSVGTYNLERVGCDYLEGVGAAHGLPVTFCRMNVGGKHPDGTATANFTIKQGGVGYVLQLRFIHSTWSVSGAGELQQ